MTGLWPPIIIGGGGGAILDVSLFPPVMMRGR